MWLVGELSLFDLVTITVEESFELIINEHVGCSVIGDRTGRDDCWDLLVFIVSREDVLPFFINILLPQPIRECIRDWAWEVRGFMYRKDWFVRLLWDIVIRWVYGWWVWFYSETVKPVMDGPTMVMDDESDDGGADTCCYKRYSNGDKVGDG